MAALLFLAPLLAPLALGHPTKRFSVLSSPIHLRQGEVHNAWVQPGAMPADFARRFANRTVNFQSFQLDIVRPDGQGGLVPLPLYETYNHHHALLLGPMRDLEEVYKRENGSDPLNPPHLGGSHHKHGCMMKGSSIRELLRSALEKHPKKKIAAFGGASGAEFRGTPTRIPEPFAYQVWNPEAFMVLMHFINTRGVPHEKKLWECPCTKARRINVTNGTIDGVKPLPFQCSDELLAAGNTACSLATYQGGYRCCEHGVFLLDEEPSPSAPVDTIQVQFTFDYYDEEKEEGFGLRSLEPPSCCDATAGGRSHPRKFANIEYDVPKCAAGTPPEQCVHTIHSLEYFDQPHGNASHDPNEELDLVHAWGHQHVGALSLELIRESTGELLCRTQPQYGTGGSPGDEAGFVVGIPPCVWGPPPLKPPPRLRRGELMRTVARYNSTEAHHGVMSLWLMNAAKVPGTGIFI